MRATKRLVRTALLIAMLAETMLAASQPAIGKHKACTDPNSNRPVIACGENACPRGTDYKKTIEESAPECSGSCVDMKSLGWKYGHKSYWCKSRGFDGVYRYPGSVTKGGCCVRRSPDIVKPTDEALMRLGF